MSARRWLDALQPVVPRARRGVAVLAYHLVGEGTQSPVDIPLTEFRRQMDVLHSRCRVVSLDAAMSSSSEIAHDDRPAVVLTFDDAYLNFRTQAWPILAERNFPVVLYVPVAFVNGDAPCPIRGTALPACSWTDLVSLSAEGVGIGSHTVSHVNLARASLEVVDRELRESRQELEQRVGVPVTSFCYPQAKWTRGVLRRVRSVFDSAVVAGGRRFVPGRDDRHSIPRFPIRRDLEGFESLLRAPVWISEAAADLVRQYVP